MIRTTLYRQVEPLDRVSNASIDEVRHALEVNLLGPLTFIQGCLPLLRKSTGRIVILSSAVAEIPSPGMFPYCCSKAGLEMLTAILAKEEPEICVVAVRPGIVATDMLTRLVVPEAEGKLAAEQIEFLRKATKLDPSEPGSAIGKLALKAPWELSGTAVEWNDPKVTKL